MNRQEFLKVLGLLPTGYAVSHFVGNAVRAAAKTNQQNVLMVVFDSLSANHMSLHGYSRDTVPMLNELAEKAVVFHQHYAAGPFTSPGTASLLSGTLPWKNRAFRYNATLPKDQALNNIFAAFSDYHRVAYSHNPLVNTLFQQFEQDLDEFKNKQDLFLSTDFLSGGIFARDHMVAQQGLRDILSKKDGVSSALFLSDIFTNLTEAESERILAEMKSQFPRGLPELEDDNYFILEDAIDWIDGKVNAVPEPFLGYFHLWPPHHPYRTRRDFVNIFKDSLDFLDKPIHPLATNERKPNQIKGRHKMYDEFIPYVDSEFARLYQSLEDQGVLENTWLVLTSDHGEMFERGEAGHMTRLLSQPLIHIPLVIFPPGQDHRVDIHAPTSSIDVLPTMLSVTGHPVPAWIDGNVLPPFGDATAFEDRPVFTVEAKFNRQYKPLTHATFTMIQWPYKVIYYVGYSQIKEPGRKLIEIFDLATDPAELNDIYDPDSAMMKKLVQKLKQEISKHDAPYVNVE